MSRFPCAGGTVLGVLWGKEYAPHRFTLNVRSRVFCRSETKQVLQRQQGTAILPPYENQTFHFPRGSARRTILHTSAGFTPYALIQLSLVLEIGE